MAQSPELVCRLNNIHRFKYWDTPSQEARMGKDCDSFVPNREDSAMRPSSCKGKSIWTCLISFFWRQQRV